MPVEALFIDLQPGALGRRFALHHVPRSATVRGLVLYVHPFAEEMNKSRRVAALQSAALAEAGWAVLQFDLLGCGDSDGDFGQASWAAWVDDVVMACQWLRRRHGPARVPLWLWGLRAGCLLAAQAAQRLDDAAGFLFWQPVLNGQVLLQQFLRLKLAGDLLGGSGKQALDAARRALAEGRNVEIAGYSIAPALAQGLEQARLDAPAQASVIEWFDLTARADLTPSPAADGVAAAWSAAGHALRRHHVIGPSFWQTSEIEVCPDLIEKSVAALSLPTTRHALRPLAV